MLLVKLLEELDVADVFGRDETWQARGVVSKCSSHLLMENDCRKGEDISFFWERS